MVDASTLAGLTETTNTYEIIAELLGVSVGAATGIIIVLGIWALIWKGFALWKSSQKKSIPWFIILLVVNTMGILEILYIFIFSKISFKGKKVNFEKSKKKK